MVFHSHIRVINEFINLLSHHVLRFRIQFQQQSEQSYEVHQSSDCHDRYVSELLYHLCHVSDYDLRQHLQDHLWLEFLPG
jgi:hypothetical protein